MELVNLIGERNKVQDFMKMDIGTPLDLSGFNADPGIAERVAARRTKRAARRPPKAAPVTGAGQRSGGLAASRPGRTGA